MRIYSTDAVGDARLGLTTPVAAVPARSTLRRLLGTVGEDAIQLALAAEGNASRRSILRTVMRNDSFAILMLWRLRVVARRFHIPIVNHLMRRLQTIVYGIELGNDITLGHGVYFIHPIGIVVGGTARIGDRVKFMGSNTVGTATGQGYPTIAHDAVIGAGARVLGPVHVGSHAVVGANAVVIHDVPRDHVAVGMPARSRPALRRLGEE